MVSIPAYILLFLLAETQQGLVPVPEEPAALPEMEDLLHMAIRHSNLTKLRDMAENGFRLNQSDSILNEVMHALRENQELFSNTVTHSLILQDLPSEEQYLAALDFIEDYGDHHVDKGDMLYKMHALEPLLDTVLKRSVNEKITTAVIERAADLLVSITQNRESTQLLVFSLRPAFLNQLIHNMQNIWRCFPSKETENLCVSLIGVLNGLYAENSRLDDTLFQDLAGNLTTLDPESRIFPKLLTTFRIASMHSHSSDSWALGKLDLPALLSISTSAPLHVSEKILRLVESIPLSLNVRTTFSALQNRCFAEKGSQDDWCQGMQPKIVLDHSYEL